MSDTTEKVETVNVEPPKNDVTPSAPVETPKAEDNAVEELRKQLQQQEMRANQLANQLKSKEEQEALAKQKELEEQSEFKTLFEQEKAKREALEAERLEAEQKAELQKARTQVLSEYNDEVRALAEEVGLDLTATDDNAVAAFKEKLDKINTRVAATSSVGPNNRQSNNTPPELSKDELRDALRDDDKFHDIVTARFPGIAAMTKPKS